ncbi:MAG: DUF3298 domain-containing protein [Gammaproteobacteria bacterium]|nr:DUF3298 domain-containing protein [Gammaproteobacteria bacterium]
MSRSSIPADVKRAVLVEAGHRCAIPRCGQTELDIHHIIPYETCQKHEYSNLIALCPVCHRRAHNGEIDRKSLLIYKKNLAIDFNENDSGGFSAPIVEIRRRIREKEVTVPGYTFKFDFPDFQEPVEKIVSKNIEAWGYELLTQFRENQEEHVIYAGDKPIFTAPSRLFGSYSIVRHDSSVISIRYTLDYYFTGSAHGGRTTKVQNFFIAPFQPISIESLLQDGVSLPEFAEYVRSRLAATGKYDQEWLLRGTEPVEDNFSLFNIEWYGVSFTFSEYQIDCYAAGEQHLWLSYDELRKLCNKSVIESLWKSGL